MSEKSSTAAITIEETTLRDGEQMPGVTFLRDEKIHIAEHLERLLLAEDTLDIGFPATSADEAATVSDLVRRIRSPYLLGVSRMREADIEATRDAMCHCDKRVIALVVPVSELHRRSKLGLDDDEALIDMACVAVRHARRFFPFVAVALEDATGPPIGFLAEIVESVIRCGATIVTVADTVGIADPWSYGEIFAALVRDVRNIGELTSLGAHCHNDLGFATANSIAAVRAGANRIGCAMNGIGERAGNAATEEVLIALHIGQEMHGIPNTDGRRYDLITEISRLVSELSGVIVPPNKAIVGANCFRHRVRASIKME